MTTKLIEKRNLKPIQLILLFGLLFVFNLVSAQTPDWIWAKKAGGLSNEGFGAMTTDPQGNVYVTGSFLSKQISVGSFTLINSDSTNSTTDVYVSKYTSTGNVLWAKKIGKIGFEESHAISIDTSGNIYVGGQFRTDTVFFSNDTLVNATSGYEDVFILKYDTNGNEIWAKKAGNVWHDEIYSSTTDQLGNVYFTGGFMGSTITFGSFTLNNPVLYSFNMFIVKLDSNGNTIWAKTVGGTSSVNGNSISIDPSGNIFVGGYFNSTQLIIGIDTMYTAGGADIFIAKYNSSGNAIWARRVGDNQWDLGYSLIADAFGSVCIVGNFSSNSIIFGSDTLVKNGVYNMFVAKYNAAGTVLWAKNAGGTSNAVSANAITIDCAGDYYVGGNFYWPTLIIGNDTLLNYDTIHFNNTFLAKYNSGGSGIWAKSNGGNDNDEIYSLATDLYGNVYAAGLLGSPTMAFDTVNITNSSIGALDIFVSKLQTQSIFTNVNNTETNFSIRIYPNPFNYSATIEFNTAIKNGELSIYNVYGQKLKTVKNIFGSKIEINRANLNSGIYFYEIKLDSKRIKTEKLIITD